MTNLSDIVIRAVIPPNRMNMVYPRPVVHIHDPRPTVLRSELAEHAKDRNRITLPRVPAVELHIPVLRRSNMNLFAIRRNGIQWVIQRVRTTSPCDPIASAAYRHKKHY